MIFGKKSWYVVVLSTVCVLLSSGMGIRVSKHFGAARKLPTTHPAECPTVKYTICKGSEPDIGVDDIPLVEFYAPLLSVLVLVTLSLILWKLLTECSEKWVTIRKWLADKIIAKSSSHRGNESAESRFRSTTFFIRTILHSLAVMSLLACIAVEIYFFQYILDERKGTVYSASWSFGQIVGLTTWLAIFVELVYFECRKLHHLLPMFKYCDKGGLTVCQLDFVEQ